MNPTDISEMVVAKFGGTSVADFEAMEKCAEIILSNQSVKLIVLSASAGVTNLLVDLAKGLDTAKRNELLAEIRRIQYKILDKLPNAEQTKTKIDNMLDNIALLSEAASLATSAALVDELVCHGELMSTLLFTQLLQQKNISAEWFDIRQVMRTDDAFGKAEPNTKELSTLCKQHLVPRLQQSIVVTQGFIGSEQHGKTTTLGRGGSDYTAALLAEALNLAQVDIWTDVPGIYTTDPRIVPNAKRIDEISFAEAAEMATFGAKILHPATLTPAIRCGIPVFVGSSKAPEAGGTRIYKRTDNQPLFRALALRRKQTLLVLHSLNMLHARGFLANVFNILVKHHISVDLVTTSEVSVALTLDSNAATSGSQQSLLTPALLAELSTVCRVEVEEEMALVTLVGNQLLHACGIGKEVFGVMSNINIRMICYGASSHNLCFLVPGTDADHVIQTLHKTLFE